MSGGDGSLLRDVYEPALGRAVRYDRCTAYFRSSALAAAARGFGQLIRRLLELGAGAPRPAIRLIVHEDLCEEDRRALLEYGDTSEVEKRLLEGLVSPVDLLQSHRLAMLAWLVKERFLDVRVGLMRAGQGILHAKFGIVTDQWGDELVFTGSGNETREALEYNYELLQLFRSWVDAEESRCEFHCREFAAMWEDRHPHVRTVALPEMVRARLVEYSQNFSPEEVPIVAEREHSYERQRAAMVWQFLAHAPFMDGGERACEATAPVELWPHQRLVVRETLSAWPEGRLLCDEVGLGKTIEAIAIIRNLLAGRGVQRALILVPAGLMLQWQQELREKGALEVPRWEKNALVWPDGTREDRVSFDRALSEPLVILSRELARLPDYQAIVLKAPPWDLVVVDEAHAARRKKQEEGEFNSPTLLLGLMRELQLRRRARSFLLLSATPMQTHPWEPWDVLTVLGEGGLWLSEFDVVRRYYDAIRHAAQGFVRTDEARHVAWLVREDEDFPDPPAAEVRRTESEKIQQMLVGAPASLREQIVAWLRKGAPLNRRMHRTTRITLQRYAEKGLVESAPPTRKVCDQHFSLCSEQEQTCYSKITRYIDARFAELEQQKRGKGFVMTIYRRRAASSFYALAKSFERRRTALEQKLEERTPEDYVTTEDMPESWLDEDIEDQEVGTPISAELPQSPEAVQRELQEIDEMLKSLAQLGGRDSKRDFFLELLQDLLERHQAILVFTQYADTLRYLRENLERLLGSQLACYTGEGGLAFEDGQWVAASKARVTQLLEQGRIRVLLCTEAASEGLNLQAASALINYDLPWNPARVEQRIGRIDRIGQKRSEIEIHNLLLSGSIDDRVYTTLHQRCDLFEHFVGPMQPVLQRARRMLLGYEEADVARLEEEIARIEREPLAMEVYRRDTGDEMEHPPPPPGTPLVTKADLEQALELLNGRGGIRAEASGGRKIWRLTGVRNLDLRVSWHCEVLEDDPAIKAFSLLNPLVTQLADLLDDGDRMVPLVVESVRKGAFKVSCAAWVYGDGQWEIVRSCSQLLQLIREWDGTPPPENALQEARSVLHKECLRLSDELYQRAEQCENKMRQRQLTAARWRLLLELGRYLVARSGSTSRLNEHFYRYMCEDTPISKRLAECYRKLNDYPEWPKELLEELARFKQSLKSNEQKARLAGSEIEAALADPRWQAAEYK
ncbi:MAG: helicase-related protein [Candidatus Sumerlaeaceae bacterium]|nr:helicase-related protein [Candidatus Sumerlaeaceae bacterium]